MTKAIWNGVVLAESDQTEIYVAFWRGVRVDS